MTDPLCESSPVRTRLDEVASLAARIYGRLLEELEKLGLDSEKKSLLSPMAAEYHLERDPYSGEETLVGAWRDERRMKQGELLFHADGSFMVEQDIGQVHPSKPTWFIEAVTAWGRGEDIKSEPRLLPMPE